MHFSTTFCSVRNTKLDIEWCIWSKLLCNESTCTSMFVAADWCCRLCRALKYSNANTFRVGLFAGWQTNLIFKSIWYTASKNSGLDGQVCSLSLSCWIGAFAALQHWGSFSLIDGNTFCNNICQYFTFVTDGIAFIFKVPARLFPLDLSTNSIIVKGYTSIFPSKHWFDFYPIWTERLQPKHYPSQKLFAFCSSLSLIIASQVVLPDTPSCKKSLPINMNYAHNRTEHFLIHTDMIHTNLETILHLLSIRYSFNAFECARIAPIFDLVV